MQIEQKARISSGSIIITIPVTLVKWLGIEEGETIVFQDEDGKKGKYFSAWRKKDEKQL